MIKVFECLGVQTFEKDGKKGTNIYYSEPFDEYEKNCSGVKCNHLFTYKNITVPMGGFCFIFEHINIFFYREILWNIIIVKKISIIIFIR